MKNQKQTWLLVGLFILASTLSIISYLILTQFVAFLLQVVALIQQGGGVTVTDVFAAIWQTFGVKILLPLFALGSWYVLAEFFTNPNQVAMKQRAFIMSGTIVVFMAVMLGLTWETFADVPMIVVMLVPAIVVAIFASLKETPKAVEQSAVAEELEGETPVLAGESAQAVTVEKNVVKATRPHGQKRSKKTQTHYRRYL